LKTDPHPDPETTTSNGALSFLPTFSWLPYKTMSDLSGRCILYLKKPLFNVLAKTTAGTCFRVAAAVDSAFGAGAGA
jgi:hypothetical protein